MLLSLIINSTIFAHTLTGADVIDSLSLEEREAFEESLCEYDVDEEFVRAISLEVDQESKVAKLKLNNGDKALTDNQSLWAVNVGASYFWPMGAGANVQLQPGIKNTRLILEGTTTGRFARGSVQTYSASFVYKFGKSGVFVGPVAQRVHMYNPMLFGQKNFFYSAYGLVLGEELTPTVFNKQWTLQVFGQATLGGLNQTMVPFMIVGAGARINLSPK